jgi:hypothetical protein
VQPSTLLVPDPSINLQPLGSPPCGSVQVSLPNSNQGTRRFLVNRRKPRMQALASPCQVSGPPSLSPPATDGLLSLSSFNDLAATLHRLLLHDFVLLFLPPYGPHLVPSATGSLKPSLLVTPSPGGHLGIHLSRVLHLHQRKL